MKPRINVITLAVGDLNRALEFYRDGLGLATEGIVGTEFEDGAVAFFNMNDNIVLALWPRTCLVKDSKVSITPTCGAEFSLGHNVSSKEQVDAVMRQAEMAGAKVTDPAHDRFWGGYSGYFQDPDGHLWEVVWNPQSPVKE